jgi:hypothetical protein
LPAWVNDAAQDNYNLAKSLDSQVAPLSDTTKQAFQFFKDNLSIGADDTAAASDIFRRLGDPNSFASDIGGYMNPYINEVEGKSLDAIDRNRQIALMGNADAATKAKAFGGSRSAVVDAITNSESLRDAGLLSAQLRQQGYSDAVTNRRNDLSTSGQGLLASGDQKLAGMLKTYQGLSGIGSQEQAQAQAELNTPLDKLNRRLAALGMTPYESTSTSKQTGTAGSAGFDWGAGILGGLSILAGLL